MRVDGPLPSLRHDNVAATASRPMKAAGMIQSAPRAMPIAIEMGTCSQMSAINALLVVSRRASRSLLSTVMRIPLYVFEQAPIACGSIVSQTPASRSRVSPSWPSGRHHQNRPNSGLANNRGVGRCGGQKHTLSGPPGRKGNGDNFGVGICPQRQRSHSGKTHQQQNRCVEPDRPPGSRDGPRSAACLMS